MEPLVLVTGFGAFEEVRENPSGALAHAVAEDPPVGVSVHAAELPVTFRGAPKAIDAALASLAPRTPSAILCMGVHPGPGFRLESRARARMGSGRPDNEGVTGDALDFEGAPDLATRFELEPLAAALSAAGADAVGLSVDAGGYVCERVFRHALEVGERLGVPAQFLHVPPAGSISVEEQFPIVRALLIELLRQV